jgi:hypothetical protein
MNPASRAASAAGLNDASLTRLDERRPAKAIESIN